MEQFLQGNILLRHLLNEETLFTNFQPDNWRGSEHCMEMLHTGKWNDQNCKRTRQVLCEKFID